MRDLTGKTKLLGVLVLTVGLVVLGAFNLRDRLSVPGIPDDGVEWVESPDGVVAKSVSPNSPLLYKVRPGDVIKAFYYVGSQDETGRQQAAVQRSLDYEEVTRADSISRYLDRQGAGNNARYAIQHHDQVLKKILGL